MTAPDAPNGMQRVEGFVQRFPNDAQPATERTVVYVGYDRSHLYVVFICFDRDARKLGVHMVPRDVFPTDEDTVAVQLDTFRDLKHAYGFQVNALGAQTDGTYTEGSGWDTSWDAVWHSEGRPTDRGFVVLFRIPFQSLRFPATAIQQWGIFFYRRTCRIFSIASRTPHPSVARTRTASSVCASAISSRVRCRCAPSFSTRRCPSLGR